MRKNKKQRRVMFLLILILGITIGFALLSTTLFINGTAGIKGNTWNIHWDDGSINVTTGSVSADDPVVSTVTTTKDTVSFDVELEMPGDFYEFEIDAINEGTVDGALDLAENWITYTINDQSASLPSYMDFKVTYDDDSVPQSGDILSKRVDANTPGRQKYKIRVEFKSGVEELPSNPQPVTITVELPYVQHKDTVPDPEDFSDDSWETIEKAAKNGTACETYQVGDTKTISMGENVTHTLRIANCSKPAVCNSEKFSQTACGLVIEFADVFGEYAMNNENTTQGGWANCTARTYLNTTIYNSLPDDLKSVIKDTYVVSGHGPQDENNFVSNDKLFYFSLTEIFGETVSDTATNKTRQLDYYTPENVNPLKKFVGTNDGAMWSLRSMNSDNTTMYNVIDNGGYGNNTSASWGLYRGLSPAFKVG